MLHTGLDSSRWLRNLSVMIYPQLPKSFDTVVDSGFTTLVAGGCSFTANYSDTHRVAWPYVLADKLNIPTVLNCALGGAGNRHISHSVQWCLETQQPDPATTLVICMWSGHRREDAIVEAKHIPTDRPTFYYTPGVATAVLSGQRSLMGRQSSAVESFLSINALYNYLQAQKYRFLFLDFMDRSLPNRSNDFELVESLPPELHQRVREMIPGDIENFYRWSLQRMLLTNDDFHPGPQAHEGWCNDVLMPYVINKFDLPLATHTHAV